MGSWTHRPEKRQAAKEDRQAAQREIMRQRLMPTCPYCHKADPSWGSKALEMGKRTHPTGCGVEYHCMNAFYGAQ